MLPNLVLHMADDLYDGKRCPRFEFRQVIIEISEGCAFAKCIVPCLLSPNYCQMDLEHRRMIVKFLRQVLYFEECLFRLAELQPKLGALDPQCVLQWHWTSGNGDCAGTTGRFEPGFAWPWRANHPLYRHYEIQGCAAR